MAIETVVFGAASLLMFLGTVGFLYLYSGNTGDLRDLLVPAVITLIAGVAYATMTANSAGVIEGDLIREIRYADWLLTTPLIVYYIARVVEADRGSTIAAMLADAAMIVLGYVASVSTGAVKWIAFGLGSLAFLVVFYLLVATIAEAAADKPPAVQSMFVSLRDLTAFLWVIYPLMWLAGPWAFEVFSEADYHFVIAVLDTAAKVGFDTIIAVRVASLANADWRTLTLGGETA